MKRELKKSEKCPWSGAAVHMSAILVYSMLLNMWL